MRLLQHYIRKRSDDMDAHRLLIDILENTATRYENCRTIRWRLVLPPLEEKALLVQALGR